MGEESVVVELSPQAQNSHKATVEFGWCCSDLKAQLWEDLFPRSLTCCWQASGPHWLLARNISSLPLMPLHRTTYNLVVGVPQGE